MGTLYGNQDLDISREWSDQVSAGPFYSMAFLNEIVPELAGCRNISFAITENKRPLAIVPLFIERKWGVRYGRMSPVYGGGPAFCGDFPLTKKAKIALFAREVLKSTMAAEGVLWLQFRQSVFSQPPFLPGLDLGHMVIDLGTVSYSLVLDTGDPGLALENMESQSRGAIRRATSEGVTVEHHIVSGDSDAVMIAELYDQIYRSKGYATNQDRIRRFWAVMAKLGNARLFLGRNRLGTLVSYAVIHAWNRFAYYSAGGTVRHAEHATGAANLVQWEIIRFLHERGIMWYELSHSSLLSPNEGKRTVAEFKRSLGAQEYPYLRGFLYRGSVLDRLKLNPRF